MIFTNISDANEIAVKRFISQYVNDLEHNTRLYALCSRLEIAPVSGFRPRHNQRIGQSVYNYYFENCVLPIKMSDNFPALFYSDDKTEVVNLMAHFWRAAMDELKVRLSVGDYGDVMLKLDALNDEKIYSDIEKGHSNEEVNC